MVLVDGKGVPLGVHLSPANLAESQLADTTLDQVAVPRRGPGRPRKKPERIVADKGYDSRGLHLRMKRKGILFIAPHLRNRKNPFQDCRHLRRYKRRWIVERTIAWLFNFRRLTVRYEHKIELFQAFILSRSGSSDSNTNGPQSKLRLHPRP
jgi:transposase